MVMAGSLPQVGQNAQVNLNGVDIRVNLDKYVVSKADRFGQKIAQGDLRYQDFNPFESAESIANMTRGAGVLRLSDVEHTLSLAHPYKEASGVNCGSVPAILGPQQIVETLPASNGPPVWAGEFVPNASGGVYVAGTRYFVCVAGTKIFVRNASGSGAWTDTGIVLPAVPLRQATGVFKGYLIMGFGAANVARATQDLTTLVNVTDTVPTALYVFALTTERAASYIAGGTAVTNTSQILSSTGAVTGYTGAVQTDSGSGGVINSLAPGGGIALVYVGKDTELGQINLGGTYDTLVPFDTRWPTNCVPLKWWLGSGSEQQRGPVSLVFPRERSLMNYAPSTTDGGSLLNISPWANPVVRPPNSRGTIKAIQGTARWLYFTVTTAAGRSWVWRRDSVVNKAGENASHTYLDLGTNVSQCLSVSAITSVTGNPLLFVGYGNNIMSVILPLDGDTELDDPNCRFTGTGTLDLSEIDLGFPDEDKVAFTTRLVSDSLVPGGQSIDVQMAVDGGAYQDLGTITSGPGASVSFPSATIAKRIAIRLVFSTNDPGKTPQLWALSVRVSLNTALYRLVEFEGAITAGGLFSTGADNMNNPHDDINALWAALAAGIPIPFTDRWSDNFMARILDFSERQATMEPDHTPETQITVVLLLTSGASLTPSASVLYDTAAALYDVPTSIYT